MKKKVVSIFLVVMLLLMQFDVFASSFRGCQNDVVVSRGTEDDNPDYDFGPGIDPSDGVNPIIWQPPISRPVTTQPVTQAPPPPVTQAPPPVTQAPTPLPVAPTITTPNSSAISATTSLMATWSTVAYADSYVVSLREIINGADGNLLLDRASTSMTSYPLPGIKPGKTYRLAIAGVASGRVGTYTQCTFAVSVAPPPAPTITSPNSTYISATNALVATWGSVTNAASYYVSLREIVNGTDGNLLLDNKSITSTSYQLTSIQPGKTYRLAVAAVASGLVGSYAQTTFTVNHAPPTAPTNLIGSRSGTINTLNWNPSSSTAGIKEYKVFRNGEELSKSAGTYTNYADDISGTNSATGNNLRTTDLADRTSQVSSTLSVSTFNLHAKVADNDVVVPVTVSDAEMQIEENSYIYTVIAIDTNGNRSAASNQISIIVAAPPAAPIITSPNSTNISATNALLATWDAVTNATSYIVSLREIVDGANGSLLLDRVSTTSTNYQLPGIQPGKKYSLKIAALASGYTSSYTEFEFTVNSAPVVVAPPTTPTNITAELVNGNTIILKWDPSTSSVGIQEYVVERDGEALPQLIVDTNCTDTLPVDPVFSMIENGVGGPILVSSTEPSVVESSSTVPSGVELLNLPPSGITASAISLTGITSPELTAPYSTQNTSIGTIIVEKLLVKYALYAIDKTRQKSKPIEISVNLLLDDYVNAPSLAKLITLSTPLHTQTGRHHNQADVDAFKFIAVAGGRYTFSSTSDVKMTLLDVTDHSSGVPVNLVSVNTPSVIPPVNTVIVSPPLERIGPSLPGTGRITDPIAQAQTEALATVEAQTTELTQPDGGAPSDTDAIKVGTFYRDLKAGRSYVILVTSTSTKAVPGAYGFVVQVPTVDESSFDCDDLTIDPVQIDVAQILSSMPNSWIINAALDKLKSAGIADVNGYLSNQVNQIIRIYSLEDLTEEDLKYFVVGILAGVDDNLYLGAGSALGKYLFNKVPPEDNYYFMLAKITTDATFMAHFLKVAGVAAADAAKAITGATSAGALGLVTAETGIGFALFETAAGSMLVEAAGATLVAAAAGAGAAHSKSLLTADSEKFAKIKPSASANAKKLKNNMLKQRLIDPSYQLQPLFAHAAHHIVPGGWSFGKIGAKCKEMRQILADCGIDVNDAFNGVFLPTMKGIAGAGKATVHKGKHTGAYVTAIHEMFMLHKPTTHAKAVALLEEIRVMLLNGTLPLN